MVHVSSHTRRKLQWQAVANRYPPSLRSDGFIGANSYPPSLHTDGFIGATGESAGGNNLEPIVTALDPTGATKTITAAMECKAITDAIAAAITATNTDGTICPSNASKIQKFTILPFDFSQDGTVLGPYLFVALRLDPAPAWLVPYTSM
jgi:hypothetical protein